MSTLPLKLAFVSLLAAVVVGCGVRIRDDESDDADADARHELVLGTSVGMGVRSETFRCHRRGDADVTDVELLVQDGEAAGMRLDLELAGNIEEGESLTHDNSSHDRYFAARLVMPSGEDYRFDSLRDRDLETRGALTILRQSDFVTGTRLWIDRMPSPSSLGKTIDIRATVQCTDWH